MSTDIRPAPPIPPIPKAEVLQVIVYGHSALFYWWPLWVAGYVMALLTWLHHDKVVIGNKTEWFHPSRNLGVIYTLLLLLLIVVTSSQDQGHESGVDHRRPGFPRPAVRPPELVGRDSGLARPPIDFPEPWLLPLLLLVAFCRLGSSAFLSLTT